MDQFCARCLRGNPEAFCECTSPCGRELCGVKPLHPDPEIEKEVLADIAAGEAYNKSVGLEDGPPSRDSLLQHLRHRQQHIVDLKSQLSAVQAENADLFTKAVQAEHKLSRVVNPDERNAYELKLEQANAVALELIAALEKMSRKLEGKVCPLCGEKVEERMVGDAHHIVCPIRAALATYSKAELSKDQESRFHPDWSMLQATRESLREHMALAKALQKRVEDLRTALIAAREALTYSLESIQRSDAIQAITEALKKPPENINS